MLSPSCSSSHSLHIGCMAMEESSPTKLCRSRSFPSRPPPPVLKSSSAVTRPYASAIKPSLKPPSLSGSIASSIKPSALLQRRSKAAAAHGFTISAVNTSTPLSDPPPPPPPPPLACYKQTATAYEVLQISPSASQQEIKTAFWRLARQHHPDKVPFEQKDASTIAFLQIHSAYVALKDPEARALYDAQMSMESSGFKQKFSGVDVKTPFTYRPHTNIFTPRGATSAAASTTPHTTRTQGFSPAMVTSYPPNSHFYTPKTPAAGASHNFYTPRTPSAGASPNFYTPKSSSGGASPKFYTPRSPFTTGRSWETDQCW